MIGIFRSLAGRRRTADPGRQEIARPRACDRAACDARRAGRRTGRRRRRQGRPLRPADRPHQGTARLAEKRTRGQPDRHSCAWHSACVSAASARPKRKPRSPPICKGREDWREVPLVTIDPADAKDHDDAVYRRARSPIPDNRGGHIVTVAIADVAHYVRPGSALDREALERGNSVYFPDRVVPMLPERISNDLCSLKPNVDRAALAVRMVIAPDGRKRSHTLPSRADALGGEAALRAGAGRHRRHAPTTPPARSRSASSIRSTPPIARCERRATRAVRSISICPNARSC